MSAWSSTQTASRPTASTPAASTSSASTPTPTPTHEIEIKLEELRANYLYTFPEMRVMETVRYFSKDGEVTIHFSGHSPFRHDETTDTQVPGGVILTLVKSSEDRGLQNDAFHCGCSVKLSSGEEVGWPKLPNAGGEQPVGKPLGSTP
jgi:hypothetical protein